MDISKILISLNGNGCVQDVSIVDDLKVATKEYLMESDGEEEKDAIELTSLGEQLHATAVLRRAAYFFDTVGDTFVLSLPRLYADMRGERSRSARQTTVDSFLT